MNSLLKSALFGVILSGAASAQVVLNEVSYDADGGDEGAVFVEIFGPAGTDVSGWTIAGYELGTATTSGALQGSSNDQFTFPAGSIIPADGLLVVADGDMDGGVTSVPNADFVDADMDLENGADAVVLVDAFGTVVDALGYGTPNASAPPLATNGPAAGQVYFEGNTARDPFAPLSLQRCADGSDTNDNAADFTAATPTPGVLNGSFCGSLQSNGLNGASFNSVSISGGGAIGFETFTSAGQGLPQVMLVAITDPSVIPPPAGFPVFDAATSALLGAVNTPLFPMFFIPALPSNNVEGNLIQMDASQFPVLTGLPFDVFIGFTVLTPTGFVASSNVAQITINS